MMMNMYLIQFLSWCFSLKSWNEKWGMGIQRGIELSIMTLCITFFLEVCSLSTVRQVWKQPGGIQLYQKALFYNVRNHFVWGVPTYAVAVTQLCATVPLSQRSWWKMTSSVILLISLHDLMYYQAHKTFHSSSTWYKFHKFHHQFHYHTPPITANAVTTVEYMIAYVFPFALAAAFLHPTELELRISVSIISVMNLLEHTPALDKIMLWPRWLVSPHQHLEHHRKGTIHYAAPVFNIDWLYECWKPYM